MTSKNRNAIIATVVYATLLAFWLFRHAGEAFAQNVNLDTAVQLWKFNPYISTLLYHGALNIGGENAVLALGFLIFPALCCYLLIQLFGKYVDDLWAIALAYCSLISFSSIPFRNFLVGLLSGELVQSGEVSRFAIAGFPIPAFSTFVFLAIFFYCLNRLNVQSLKSSLVFSAAWSLFAYVHPVDAVFGLVFWFSYLTMQILKSTKVRQNLPKTLGLNLAISLLLLLPGLWEVHWGVLNVGEAKIGFYYYCVYFLLPLAFMSVIYFIQKVDLYEIRVKFWHIYCLMLTEFVIVFCVDLFGFGFDMEIVRNRIPLFFLHFYYYIPVIYYATRAPMSYGSGSESANVSQGLKKASYWFFANFSRYYLPLFLILFIAFGIFAGE